jgi:hypothetical protein
MLRLEIDWSALGSGGPFVYALSGLSDVSHEPSTLKIGFFDHWLAPTGRIGVIVTID